MTTLIKFIIGLLTAVMLTSCNFDINFGQMQGNGNVITADMDISGSFDEVTAANGWEVFLEKGNSNAVVLEADENLVDAAEIYIENGDLKIKCEKNINRATSKKVYVTYVQQLSEISVNSGASLYSKEALEGSTLELDVSSGGTMKVEIVARDVETDVSSGGVMTVSGTAERLDASVSSGGVARISDLKSVSATADVSSGGVMDIYASENLKASASSGGIINYYGNPKNVDKPEKNFSGGVIKSGN